MPIRTRFAPSPTGRLHIGGARTAIIASLFARSQGGRFILRIDDTDAERGRPELEQGILEDLAWLGVSWDEGPDIGGGYAPYRQSERSASHLDFLDRLKRAGAAYPCYCTAEELESRKAEAAAAGRPPGYDGRCQQLTPEEAGELASTRMPAWRLAVPRPLSPAITFDDLLRGSVSVPVAAVADPVLLRSDGQPTYHLASVADDVAMDISHVVRGEDHLSSTVRQAVMYDALGLKRPYYLHLGLLTSRQGAKLSKRAGSDTVAACRESGVPPEALFEYLLSTGMSSAATGEFDWRMLSRSAVTFDDDALAATATRFLRSLTTEAFAERLRPFIGGGASAEDSLSVAALLHQEVRSLPAAAEYASRILLPAPAEEAEGDAAAGEAGEWEDPPSGEGSLIALQSAAALVSSLAAEPDGWRRIVEGLRAAAGTNGVSVGAYLLPVRLALTGTRKGPHLDELMELLGEAEVMKRLRRALARVV